MSFLVSCGAVVCLCGAASAQSASPGDAPKMNFTAELVPDGAVKVDGFVTDWGSAKVHETRTLTRGEPEYDWTGPRDLSTRVQLQYDSRNLYMAVEARDNVVTGPRGRDRGDRVEVWLDSGPGGGGKVGRLKMMELAIGDLPRDGKPAITWQYPRSIKGDEPEGLLKDGSLREGGYFFELAIPLTQLSDPPPGLEGIGIAIIARDLDRDDPNEDEAAVASAPFDGKKARDVKTMGTFSLQGAGQLKEHFFTSVPDARRQKIAAELFTDVGGDKRSEKVILVGHYLAILGLGLGDGDHYYYTMVHTDRHTFHGLEARDLTGDGKDELLVRYRVTNPEKVDQTMLAIYHFDQDRIKLVFHHEIANKGPGWEIVDKVSFKKNRKGEGSLIQVSRPKSAKGVSAATYPDVDKDLIVDWERLLLPWGKRGKNVFEWDVGQFIRLSP